MDATPYPRRLPLLPTAGAEPPAPRVRTLIDDFLTLQATTTPVERFAATHPAEDAPPAKERFYRDLLPATPPTEGQQYAFSVDLDACSGCKACVTACHSLNGLDEGESWREVGLLVGSGDNSLVQPVTTGCHHCEDPGCLEGCPVDAYVKDADGIVRHLDDQCIGCSYCTLTCPYEVPQFDHDRGIVRKCDMCHDRLSVGEAPACVQACPTRAISITVVDVDGAGTGSAWPFAAPDPAATRPTTRFTSSRDLTTDVAAADLHTVRPRRGHTPLAVMLVLTQLSAGAFVIWELLRQVGITAGGSPLGAAIALGFAVIGIIASLAHLGRPQYAWRAVLGIRHSWLSREIVTFGAFASFGLAHATALVLPGLASSALPAVTGGLASGFAIAAIATSVMVYAATGRAGWTAPRVAARFGLTTVHLGTLAATAGLTMTDVLGSGRSWGAADLSWIALAAGGSALAVDLQQRAHHRRAPDDHQGRTARLLRGPLAGQVQLRTITGVLSLALTTAMALSLRAATPSGAVEVMAAGALVSALTGELVARSWFFTAEGSPRMPGRPS